MNGESTRPREVFVDLLGLSRPPWGRLVAATLLGVAAAGATIGLLAGSGYLVDRASFRPGLGAIAGLLAIVEVMAFVRAPIRYGERLVAHDAAFRALTRWRVWLYDRLEPLSPAGLHPWRSGDLLTRAIDDVDTLQDLYLRGLTPIAVAVAASVLAVVVEALFLPTAALVLAGALLIGLVVPPYLAVITHSVGRQEAELRARLQADTVDLLQGAADLTAVGGEQYYLESIERADTELGLLSRRRAWLSGLASGVLVLAVGIAVVGVLVLGVQAVSRHQLHPVLLAVLPLTAVAAFDPIPALIATSLHSREVLASGRRLIELADRPAPIVDPATPSTLGAGPVGVALVDARLRYRDDLPWALDGFTVAAPPGARLGVIGPSGAGKTSLVNALLRFWPLAAGRVTLGEVPLDHLTQADVRAAVGLLDQDAHLFTRTLRENVALGRPDANDAEIAEVLGLVQLDTWARSLPLGLDTVIGESGSATSEGQRRRIALARAVLSDSPVLVLDEPTAGLDEPTAELVLGNVMRHVGDRTVIVITHRQRDLTESSDVAVIDRGRVVELRR